MKMRISFLAVLMIMILAAPAIPGRGHSVQAQAAGGGAAATEGVAESVAPVTAIIELEGEPVALREARRRPVVVRGRGVDLDSAEARGYEAVLEQEQEDFKARAALVSPGLRVRLELRKLVNAVSVEVPGRDLASIAALPGVRRVELGKLYHTTLSSSVPLVGAAAMWERLGGAGVAGEGMKIGIIDTGIDLTNPLFSDEGYTAPAGFPRGNTSFTNNKVIVAKAFLTGGGSPKDENGHGTNVAGIAAGNNNTASPLGLLSGVAPRAYLGNYRALDKRGVGTTDRITSALEEAVDDGMDVINLSLGGEADPELDVLARAVEMAVEVGKKIVVVAAGNEGEAGERTIGSPGIAPSAITVAATSNGHFVGPVVSVAGPGAVPAELTGIGAIQGANGTPTLDDSIAATAYVDVSTLGGNGRACGALPANSLNGKIALIERGNCSFADKVNAAAAAKAKAVIIYNQSASENPTDGGENLVRMELAETNIPAIFISNSNGVALRNFAAANPGASIGISPAGFARFASDVIASFSSRGPSSIEGLKPDLAAPGMFIYSGAVKSVPENATFPVLDPSGFQQVDGTSQAAPHVAGAAALVKQLHPSWTPEQVKSALMSSAVDAFDGLDKSKQTGVLAAGAGRIDVGRAAAVGVTFSPASLSFKINKLKKKTVTLSADLKVTSELDGQNNFAISVAQLDPGDGFSIAQSTPSLPLARGQAGTVTLTLTALKAASKRDYTGYVVITEPSGQTLRVPFWVRYVKKK